MWHCPYSPAAAAAIDPYLLPAAAHTSKPAAVGPRWDRQVEAQTDRHRANL